jgi:hypothetical protein
MGHTLTRELRILALMLALVLVRGLIYSAIVLPWQAPDEPYHFLAAQSPNIQRLSDANLQWKRLQDETIASLVQYHWWDFVVFEPAVRGREEVLSRLTHGLVDRPRPIAPRAYTYYILSPLLQPVRFQDVGFQLYWARLSSVLINLGIIGIASVVARLLFGSESFGRWLLPLSVMFLPTHTFIMASVNDGNPAELLISMAILFFVLLLVKGLRWYLVLAMGAFTVLGVAAKPTTIFFLPVLVAVVIIYIWRTVPGWWKVLFIPLIALVAYASTLASFRIELLVEEVLQGLVGTASEGFLTNLATVPLRGRVLQVAIGGFWAELGWHSLSVGDVWIWVVLILTAVAVIGLIKFAWRCLRRGDRLVPRSLEGHTHAQGGGAPDRPSSVLWRAVVVFFVCVVSEVGVLALGSARAGFSFYLGRYMLGATIPIMGLLVVGWRELCPVEWRREGLALMVSFFLIFDTVVLVAYALPFFYPLWR